MLAPTLVGLPITLWTWWALLGADLRAYYGARSRGLGAVAAAAFAQGLPLHPGADEDSRHRAAALVNRRLARAFAVLSFAAYVLWVIVALDSPHKAMRDEGFGVLVAAWAAVALAVAFAALSRRVERGAWLRGNAVVWTLLSPFAPRSAERARLLARKDL